MRLDQFLSENEMTAAEFGRRIGVTPQAVLRYREHLRTPKPVVMKRIIDATEGRVTPNDFAGILPEQGSENAA